MSGQLDLFAWQAPYRFAGRPVWFDQDRMIYRSDPPPWTDYPRAPAAQPNASVPRVSPQPQEDAECLPSK